MRFVGATQQPETRTPTFRSSLSECAGPHVTLVDTSIVSESMFHRDHVVRHPSGQGWVYAIVGAGLASLVRSRSDDDGLRNGELWASVPLGDALVRTRAIEEDIDHHDAPRTKGPPTR